MYKIYKIVDNTNNNVYIGQTKLKYLSSRISGHKTDFKRNKNCSSKLILKNNDWYYKLIEETNDKSRERYWIENTPNCINTRRLNIGANKCCREKYLISQKRRDIVRNNYYKSFGGNPYDKYNNSLLKIDINLFK